MKKQQGLTLIELMIAVALGIFMIAATLALYVNTVKSSSDTLKSVRLNHDLEMTLNLIGSDIKRAGYWAGAKVNVNLYNNPFMFDALFDNSLTTNNRTNIQIATLSNTNDCILYTYDSDTTGANSGTIQANEYFGFRRNVVNNVGVIEMRTSGTTTASCSDGTWQAITDSNVINVTALRFSFFSLDTADNSSPCTNAAASTCLTGTTRCWNVTTTASPNSNTTLDCAGITPTPNPATTAAPNGIVVKRVVNIILTGQVVNDSAITKTVSSTVQVRNNRLRQKTS